MIALYCTAFPGADPIRVLSMRADVTIMLLSAKAKINRLAQEAAQPASGGALAPCPDLGGGSSRSVRVTSMAQLYSLFGQGGGPRGV